MLHICLTDPNLFSHSLVGSSLLPPGVPPLPNLFTRVCAYLHGHSEDEKRRLSRLIIAYPTHNTHVHKIQRCIFSTYPSLTFLLTYNGEVNTSVTDKTTHVLCADGQVLKQGLVIGR